MFVGGLTIEPVTDRTISIVLGTILVLVGCARIVYAIKCYRSGHGIFAARHFFLETERDGDPVGFQTVVLGNAAMGVFVIVVGAYLFATAN
jgi:hypothetical protein